jgi:hypothetical protein
LEKYKINLENGNTELLKKSLDKLLNILNRTRTLNKIPVNQQSEARERIRIMSDVCLMLNGCQTINNLSDQYITKYKEYQKKENSYISGEIAYENTPSHLEEMLSCALRCLELSIKRKETCQFISNDLVLSDISRVKKIILHITYLINKSESAVNKDPVKERLEIVLTESEKKLNLIIEKTKK